MIELRYRFAELPDSARVVTHRYYRRFDQLSYDSALVLALDAGCSQVRDSCSAACDVDMFADSLHDAVVSTLGGQAP